MALQEQKINSAVTAKDFSVEGMLVEESKQSLVTETNDSNMEEEADVKY